MKTRLLRYLFAIKCDHFQPHRQCCPQKGWKFNVGSQRVKGMTFIALSSYSCRCPWSGFLLGLTGRAPLDVLLRGRGPRLTQCGCWRHALCSGRFPLLLVRWIHDGEHMIQVTGVEDVLTLPWITISRASIRSNHALRCGSGGGQPVRRLWQTFLGPISFILDGCSHASANASTIFW